MLANTIFQQTVILHNRYQNTRNDKISFYLPLEQKQFLIATYFAGRKFSHSYEMEYKCH